MLITIDTEYIKAQLRAAIDKLTDPHRRMLTPFLDAQEVKQLRAQLDLVEELEEGKYNANSQTVSE